MPSLFCPAGYPICHDTSDPSGPHVLFYPALRDPSDARTVWAPTTPNHRAIAALLGRTRARVLEAVGDHVCTTTELARRSGISVASASEHATVLRQAGLIHTQRHGSAVLHTLTALGASLLDPPPRRISP